jgi:hypothetical protein
MFAGVKAPLETVSKADGLFWFNFFVVAFFQLRWPQRFTSLPPPV